MRVILKGKNGGYGLASVKDEVVYVDVMDGMDLSPPT